MTAYVILPNPLVWGDPEYRIYPVTIVKAEDNIVDIETQKPYFINQHGQPDKLRQKVKRQEVFDSIFSAKVYAKLHGIEVQ